MQVPETQRAVVVERTGGPEVLEYRTDFPVPELKEGEILVKNTLSGINFIDTYFRTGLYPSPKPEVLGREAAGVVVKVGAKVKTSDFNVGDRVIWLGTSGYAEYTNVNTAKAIGLPKSLADDVAVASFMSGLTVLALVQESYQVKDGDWVLLHAAAGGAGFLMTQILKSLGAKVIGTAGGPEKAALVKQLGADYVIDYRSQDGSDWEKIVMEVTAGRGVDVVYDSVGKDTWQGSLNVVKRKGTIVWFGNASGPIPPLPLNLLSKKCVKICRPTLLGYLETRDEFEQYASQLFSLLVSGQLQGDLNSVNISQDLMANLDGNLQGS